MAAITFYNPTKLPIECILTFGVSVKENESPIGYFGTGLKYAIAVLLREGCKVHLNIGGEEFEFSRIKGEIRGKDFDFCYINGKMLPFTTELGKNWKLWQAYRELYSNCMDERGTISSDGYTPPEDGVFTAITVDGLEDIHNERGEFLLLDSEPIYHLKGLEVHESETPAIFYKGIKVLTCGTKYSYNITSNLSLTEDRTAQQWEVEWKITNALIDCRDKQAVTDILSITDDQFFEAKMDFSKYATPTEDFMRLLASLKNKSRGAGDYFQYHYPTYLHKMNEPAKMSAADKRRVRNLLASSRFKPAGVYFAPMAGEDYQINGNNIILSERLLPHAKRLRFAYLVALAKLNPKNSARNKDDYSIIVDHLLDYFALENAKPAKTEKKAA